MLSLKSIKENVKIIILVFLVFQCLLGATGSIRGRVTDKKTGKGLPGVNIVVKGTYYGAATDEEGNFSINGMTPGIYDLEVTMIGYKVSLITGVRVKEGEVTTVNVEMEQTVLALGQEVVVVGEKPLIEVDETSSSLTFTKDDIMGRIAESVQDIVKEQIGVVESDNQIHIRGGRVDESQFIVDGLAIKDPLTGDVTRLYVNPNAIEELEIITGGFNAEYGQAMSGIIDVKLKEGSDRFEASFSYKTDKVKGIGSNFNTDIAEFTLGGKFPITEKLLPYLGIKIPGNVYYFISGYGNVTDTYLPHASKLYPKEKWMEMFAPRQENDWSMMSKLTWKITPKHKLSISQNSSLNINQGFSSYGGFKDEYMYILDNYYTTTKGSYVSNITWTHTISSMAFYEINLGRYFTFQHNAVHNKWWWEYNETLDLEPIEYTKINEDGDIRVRQGDEYWDSGDDPHWYDYYSDNIILNFDFTYKTQSRHSFKAGLDAQYTEMQMIDIYKPWLGTTGLGQSWDLYRVYPNNGSLYIQDRIAFEGMIVNVGLRYDYWFPGKYVQDAINNPDIFTITEAGRKKFKKETFKIFGYRGKGHLSPRLGISHPVTDNDVLYFNYGHFSQLPTYYYVYAKLGSKSEATYNLVGNPNLNPKTTVAYELGIKHKFTENSAIEVKAYYKDMFDYETSQNIIAYNPKLGRYSLLMYINMDYARSRGIELIFRQRYGRFFTGDLNMSYSITTGKSSTPDDNLLVQAGRLEAKPLGENFLRWDVPFRLTANLRFKVREKKPVKLLFLKVPNNWGVNFHIDARSGRRYTPSTIIDTVFQNGQMYLIGPSQSDKPYSKIADPYTVVDMKLYKDFYISNRSAFRIFLEVENLFNTKIPRFINSYTGEPYDPGKPVAYSYINRPNPNYDPSRYYQPRTILLGVSFRY
ncbi:MAG: TonB-dependent receptor [Candidatus Marinimicrobia bacterium]|nr:TonB-dependent receptor [Candidatus Neomarinimicrobiota bacterium]